MRLSSSVGAKCVSNGQCSHGAVGDGGEDFCGGILRRKSERGAIAISRTYFAGLCRGGASHVAMLRHLIGRECDGFGSAFFADGALG